MKNIWPLVVIVVASIAGGVTAAVLGQPEIAMAVIGIGITVAGFLGGNKIRAARSTTTLPAQPGSNPEGTKSSTNKP